MRRKKEWKYTSREFREVIPEVNLGPISPGETGNQQMKSVLHVWILQCFTAQSGYVVQNAIPI